MLRVTALKLMEIRRGMLLSVFRFVIGQRVTTVGDNPTHLFLCHVSHFLPCTRSVFVVSAGLLVMLSELHRLFGMHEIAGKH